MKIRPYETDKDFEEIKNWIREERRQAMWCGYNFSFPLTKENFEKVLSDSTETLGEHPYVATTDEGDPVGFFAYAVNPETNMGKYRFVIVSPKYRGQGFGKQMMKLAVRFAFETSSADRVMLNVFPVNTAAKHCYVAAGFVEYETTPNYFVYQDEAWDCCEMRIEKNST